MSEPFFPPPQKKASAPYREAVEVPVRLSLPAERWPELREKPRQAAPPAPAKGSFLEKLAWRLAARLVALAATVGVLWALVRAHELGAKWPQAVLIMLGVVGILAAPVVLYFRLRRLVRFLFARDDDA